MVWSGLTKYLVSSIYGHGKAVEISGLAIFGPVVDKFVTLKDPLDKGPGRKQGLVRERGPTPVITVINEDFTGASDCQIDYKSDKAVGMYNKADRKEVTELFANQVVPVNTTSIAKVCLTEGSTVDLMLQELVAQMAH